MKKKIIIGLVVFSMIFLLGGIYIITTIETATSKLDNLIKLHQVEILREHLLIQVKRVQSDLNLKNTRFARNIDTVITNVRDMERMAGTCFECHHTQVMMHRLNNMRNDVTEYKKAVSRVFTIRSNISRLEAEEDKAFIIGTHLITKVNNMINLASMKLEEKTHLSLKEITETKSVLYILVLLVPFFAAGLGYIFIRGFTKPVNVLLKATRKIKSGDLNYRIEDLKDEFGEVATSFNEMSDSINQYMHEIRESENRYRTLFESAGDAIFILDAEGENAGRIVSANRAAAEMHGYTVNELEGMNIISDLDTPEAAKDSPALIQRILSGEWISMEMTHQKRNGTVFPVEVSAGLLEYMDRKYILAFDRDITERKHVENALRRAEQMKIVGEWAAGLAHEIKNSLAGIKISVEVLIEEMDVPEESREFIYRAIEEIKKIESLLKSLLNFAKPPKPSFSLTDVNDVIEKTAAFSSKKPVSNKSGKVNIVKDLDDSLPKTLADPMQLQQIFLNLFLNAFQAMPKGGDLNVKTVYDENIDSILVEVADSGSGIDKRTGNNIFQPFFTTKSKGTGLGLAITKQLVEQHGGDICFDSTKGSGTVFCISLPVNTNNKKVI
jgi:two-component system sensor histidine kinase AtoS